MRRHHQITDITVFGDFDIAHVGRKQRRYAGATDPGDIEHIVGDVLQGFEEFGVINVPLAFPVHADQQAVGTGKNAAEIQKVEHVGMTHRDLLVEAGVQPNMGGAVTKGQGHQHKKAEQHFAPGH